MRLSNSIERVPKHSNAAAGFQHWQLLAIHSIVIIQRFCACGYGLATGTGIDTVNDDESILLSSDKIELFYLSLRHGMLQDSV